MAKSKSHPSSSARETRERLLDAAEALYATRGFDGTSVRALTALAKANLAAVGYHFGSKNALILAAISRRYSWLNAVRMEWLDNLERQARPGSPDLEAVIDVLLYPVLDAYPDQPERSADLRRFFSRVHSEAPEFQKSIPIKGLMEVADRFFGLFQKLLPDLPEEDLYWRMHFSVGPIIGTLTHGSRLRSLSHGLCDPDDIEGSIRRLRSFISAGMRAPTMAHPVETRQPA